MFYLRLKNARYDLIARFEKCVAENCVKDHPVGKECRPVNGSPGSIPYTIPLEEAVEFILKSISVIL
ncbi:MAG: hypothetical protein CMO55_02470 [Verrucomicrobiales bacterium]|nr:hypothetical protein [Verrucomicrobiales bacterium]